MTRPPKGARAAPCALHPAHVFDWVRCASQRNNIATIHHTFAVNKTSGSFCRLLLLLLAVLPHPPLPSSSRRTSRSYTFSQILPFLFTIYSFPRSSPRRSSLFLSLPLSACLSIHLRRSSILFSLSDSRSDRVFTAYLFDFFFLPVLSRARPLCPVTLFCASHFLSSRPPARSFPLAHTFFLSTFPPRSTSIRFPLYVRPSVLSLSRSALVSRASTPRRERGIRVMSSVD